MNESISENTHNIFIFSFCFVEKTFFCNSFILTHVFVMDIPSKKMILEISKIKF